MITVAIDSEHTRQSSAGTARCSRSLIKALRDRTDVRVNEVGGGPLVTRGTLRKRLTTARQDFLWYPWLGRRLAVAGGADVYHCPTPRAPITRGKIPLVVTVHDLVPVLFPETMTPWSRFYGRVTMRRVLGSADLIVCPSHDTASDLQSLLGIRSERVRVVWNGVEDIFFSTSSSRPAENDPYVLFVGTPEPRKNLARLVDAMVLLRSRGYPHRLVVAGGGGWGNGEPHSNIIERIGRVSDERLLDLYSHAACLALPSLHEGFGLPAVEAMAAGTPVVAGNRGALPEVTGTAAVLVDPFDSTAIANGIEEAMVNRERLVERGRARAASFTWRRAAEQMSAVYHEFA